MSTNQPIVRQSTDWGLYGFRALDIALAIGISYAGLLIFGASLALVAWVAIVPAAVIIGLTKGLDILHNGWSTDRD